MNERNFIEPRKSLKWGISNMEGILKEQTIALIKGWGLRVLGFAQRLWREALKKG